MPPRDSWLWLVEAALGEDIGSGDVTSEALLPPGLAGEARIEAREAGVIAGLEVAREVFTLRGAKLSAVLADGERVKPGAELARVSGPARAILSAERTALNFLQQLSGVATLTWRYCEAVQGTGATILDTRKTTPGWRSLQKFAVRCGGGRNHRMGLYDRVLIKDNHLRAVGSVREAVRRAREAGAEALLIQAEVVSAEQALEAIEAGVDAVLIDNRTPEQIAAIVSQLPTGFPAEASGGVHIGNVRAVALSGVQQISVGALTHSAPALDLALEWHALSSS